LTISDGTFVSTLGALHPFVEFALCVPFPVTHLLLGISCPEVTTFLVAEVGLPQTPYHFVVEFGMCDA